MTDKVLIIDFGSQVTQLIARRVRESGVYCEIHPFNKMDEAAIKAYDPKAIILSGGPSSVLAPGSPRADESVFRLGVPVLGICYGQQTMCAQLGGSVTSGTSGEFGRATLAMQDSLLFHAISESGDVDVWMSHGDHVCALPDGFQVIGTSLGAPYAAIADEQRHFYGVQFHPEVVHTTHGAQMIRNFTHDIAGCSGDWTMANFKHQAIEKIRQKVGTSKVICGLSGGVDSSVAAVLLHEAIGDQLTCIFVDTGMMRQGEAQQVVKLFRDHYHIPLIHRDAADLFLGRLSGVTDPEQKRKIIGATFIDVFDEESHKINGAEFLAQGTLYPDVIESVSAIGGPNGGVSVTIKSHHNVGGLPEKMNLKLIEPLRDLFKDEVRKLGTELGLAKDFIARHPFPGPGLAVRLPGEITEAKLDILRQADDIYIDAIHEAGLYDDIWQAFAVLLPVKSVGVVGDARSYDHVCALRAVTSTDGMTADVYPFTPEFLTKTATKIVNEVTGIGRVVYDYTSKPPGTIEWE